jgi:hypothetical protein
MHQCPKCKASDLRRSRARSKWEAWRKQITGKRLFRCGACGWRGWGIPGSGDAERGAAKRAVAPVAPNLQGTPLTPKRTAKVNLKALDVIEPGEKTRQA